MSSALRSVSLYLRVTKRLAPRRGAGLAGRFGTPNDRLVFVVGSPRSGTTFLAGAIGSVPGFLDLGEVPPVKAAVPQLAALDREEAGRRLRRTIDRARRMGLVGSVRAVEQTPELAHIVDAVQLAFPEAAIVHIVRDGRDVVCSLLEKPWLRRESDTADDAGVSHGAYARFWVEPERREEFEHASDARRAAWVWRSYVTAARTATVPLFEVRYERLAEEPAAVAEELAVWVGAPEAELVEALGRVHDESVGRHERDLSPEDRDDVMAEAGELLAELGYVP